MKTLKIHLDGEVKEIEVSQEVVDLIRTTIDDNKFAFDDFSEKNKIIISDNENYFDNDENEEEVITREELIARKEEIEDAYNRVIQGLE